MKPVVSVVMGVYEDAAWLDATIDSVLAQTLRDFEFIIVDDGSANPEVAACIDDHARRDARIHVVRKAHEGLTVALIAGCAQAAADFIARIDVGDTMEPARLERQAAVLSAHDDCTFVSCHTAYHGPDWEPLWISTGRVRGDRPASVLPAETGGQLAGEVTHHGSVMFRTAAYVEAGGYRPQFYYGQDWDLWYRLAERGTFHVVPEVLYRIRLLPNGISARQAERQRAIARCSRGAFDARRGGGDESCWLAEAAAIRPGAKAGPREPAGRSALEPGLYFIGEALRRNRDPRCRSYLAQAIRARPSSARSWMRLLQSLALRT